MNSAPHFRRFRANPIEVALLSVVTLVFFHSLYTLIYTENGFHPNALIAMTANPISEGRSLASIETSLVTWDIDCGQAIDKSLAASKVRFNGKLCENDPIGTGSASKLLSAKILNTTTQTAANVFTDKEIGQFTTDYLPLVAGKNSIHVEFSYTNGKTFIQDLTIEKI